MKKFAGFTPQQQYTLLSKQGYTGPADEASMAKFLAASPSAASKMGEYAQIAQQRLAGQPMPTQAMAVGGDVKNFDSDFYLKTNKDVAASGMNPLFHYLTYGKNEGRLPFAKVTPTPVTPVTPLPVVTPTPVTPVSPTSELMKASITDPSSLVTEPEVAQIKETPGTVLPSGTGEAPTRAGATTTRARVTQAQAPKTATTSLMTPTTIGAATPQATAAQGEVSDEAQVTAAEGKLSDEALAEGAKFDEEFLDEVTAEERQVTSDELVTAAGQDVEAIKTEIAQSEGLADVVAEQGVVRPEELPDAATIAESDMAQATAVTADGLAPDAVAVAARLDKFSVDNETLAKAMQGEVDALDTVQGQLSQLMKSFDDGQTPAWAAGAIRSANAAMASRGLGGSSIAGAAILQAAMESAVPIAAQDAQVFQQMNLTNLNNRQQVSLANAAAQQGLQLQNLNNEQQAALQNSSNAFALQSQNLSNTQQTVLANAQIKAALQGQNLSNQQQSNLVTAARYAESANINLNNRQQTALQNNSNALNVELANLNNRQQSYIANAQLAASLQGKQIDNQQQTAIVNAARYADAANITFTAEQQSKLHNSELMKTVGLAELNAQQAATLQNAANLAGMDMANLNNRQQAAVQNAQAFLQTDLTNLNNEQQTTVFNTQNKINSLLSDQAAQNAAKQFNAASQNQTDQFFAELSTTVSRFNAEQKNAISQFNAGEKNAVSKFNAQVQAQRDQFNANNSLVVAQANAQWRQNLTTLNTGAQNEANIASAKIASGFTQTTIDNIWQRERDIMAAALNTAEGDANRSVSLMLADKDFDAVKFAQDAKDNAARSQLFYEGVNKIFNWG
jgi:hypothetical protein